MFKKKEPLFHIVKRGEMPWYCMIAHGGRVDGYGVAVQPNVFAS